jgi:hypothetical protein
MMSAIIEFPINTEKNNKGGKRYKVITGDMGKETKL